jgi:hypothetical protein
MLNIYWLRPRADVAHAWNSIFIEAPCLCGRYLGYQTEGWQDDTESNSFEYCPECAKASKETRKC